MPPTVSATSSRAALGCCRLRCITARSTARPVEKQFFSSFYSLNALTCHKRDDIDVRYGPLHTRSRSSSSRATYKPNSKPAAIAGTIQKRRAYSGDRRQDDPRDAAANEAPLPTGYGETEATILSAALSHVPQLGFTQEALAHGALDTGYLSVTASNLFPRGAFDLILYHLATQRLSLKSTVHFSSPPPSPFPPATTASASKGSGSETDAPAWRVRSLILSRLHGNAALARHLPAALAVMTLPSNLASSLQELALLADEILHLAGDTSLDAGWYTKRAAISAIYAAAEAFQSQDTSPDFVETDHFVERRLDEAGALKRGTADLAQWLGYTGLSIVNVLRSWGARI